MPKKPNGADVDQLDPDAEEFPDPEFVPLETLDEDTDPNHPLPDADAEKSPDDSEEETDYCTGCKEEFPLCDLCDECGECCDCCVCHINDADKVRPDPEE